MTFTETIDTISNWIQSCKNELQLNMCMDAIDKFIVERYKNHVTAAELAKEQSNLQQAIELKKTSIIGYGLEHIT